jgi:hypothetical protein
MKLLKIKSFFQMFLSKCIISDTIDESIYMRKSDGEHWCNECGYHSALKTDVFRHVEAKHLQQQFACKFCRKFANSKRNLQRHIRRNHMSQIRYPMNMKQVMAWHSTWIKEIKNIYFLAASMECSAGSNDHFVVGGAVPSLVFRRPLGGASFHY